MDHINSFLSQLREHLSKSASIGFEWSIKIQSGKVFDQDRLICWVEGDAFKNERYEGVTRFLEAVCAPAYILQQQKDAAAISMNQGISVAATGGDLEWRLYIHTYKSSNGNNEYRAYRWGNSEGYENDIYQFYYLPETPQGKTPLDFANPLFEPAIKELLEHERLQRASGFWVRSRDVHVLNVYLSYPWHPSLGEFHETLKELSASLGVPTDWLEEHKDHPIRHIGFTGKQKEPALAIYCTASGMQGVWPATMQELKECVRDKGKIVNEIIENKIYSQLPKANLQFDFRVSQSHKTDHIELWQQVLGPKMHYHFGMFDPPDQLPSSEEQVNAAFDKAISDLYRFIPKGSRVYDIGCGWGGPAELLIQEQNCFVEGITASRTQFRYCAARGIPVRLGDAEINLPGGYFDCMLMIESFCHIQDKLRLLKTLRLFGGRLVIRDHCHDSGSTTIQFGDTMHINSSTELRQMIEEAGWKITHWQNRRAESMPSAMAWHKRLQAIPATNDFQLEILRKSCENLMEYGDQWATENPLIEVVAE